MSDKEKKLTSEDIKKLWEEFAAKYDLTETQINQFKKYLQLLKERNEEINLTSILKDNDIIHYHFEDSLSVSLFVDFNNIKSICDIGSGAGFPGIPLKIKYPHLNVFLIEVNSKKINFLNELMQELSLDKIEICDLDWRTFLRKTFYSIDLFLSRASLHTDELVRIFKPGSPYNASQLIYWASLNWQSTDKENAYIKKEESYKVGSKKRKLIFFSK
jgi:16S rRNA (guanine527-N7)-methyltransferase